MFLWAASSATARSDRSAGPPSCTATPAPSPCSAPRPDSSADHGLRLAPTVLVLGACPYGQMRRLSKRTLFCQLLNARRSWPLPSSGSESSKAMYGCPSINQRMSPPFFSTRQRYHLLPLTPVGCFTL